MVRFDRRLTRDAPFVLVSLMYHTGCIIRAPPLRKSRFVCPQDRHVCKRARDMAHPPPPVLSASRCCKSGGEGTASESRSIIDRTKEPSRKQR